MANCNKCGVEMDSLEHTQWYGHCKKCVKRTSTEPPLSQKTVSAPKKISETSNKRTYHKYSIWNEWTYTGWVFMFLLFFSGEVISWLYSNPTVISQVVLTLTFGFIGLAWIMLGIAKTFLKVIQDNQ